MSTLWHALAAFAAFLAAQAAMRVIVWRRVDEEDRDLRRFLRAVERCRREGHAETEKVAGAEVCRRCRVVVSRPRNRREARGHTWPGTLQGQCGHPPSSCDE